MKKIGFVFALLFSVSAFANDGGVVGLTVKDLKIQKAEFVNGKTELTPIKKGVDVKATFSGENVRELMKLLPGELSVIPETSKHVRTLVLANNDGYVSIACSDATLSDDFKTWIQKAPTCEVAFSKYKSSLSDEEMTEMFGDFENLQVPHSCQMP